MVRAGSPWDVQAAAVVSRWIALPSSPAVLKRSEPYLVEEAGFGDFVEFVRSEGATTASIDIASTTDAASVITEMKAALTFPDWWGSSWDSIDDAFDEIRQGWVFPLVLIVRGMRSVLEVRPHLGLRVLIRLNELSHAFSVAGDQLAVVYVADAWN